MRDLVDQMGGGRGREPSPLNDDHGSHKSAKLHDFEMVLHYDTGKAVLVSETGEEARAVWLPKSQIEIHREGKSGDAVKKDGQVVVLPIIAVVVPEWLAKEKGLI